ncbi:MAG TPA: DMT family transporter [Sphingomicrobium sp.]
MIRTQMNGRDWLILLALAFIWGGSFFFIGVAVREVQPLTFVWTRVTVAAAALWFYLWASGQSPRVPRAAIAPFALLSVLNNIVPFALYAWAQQTIPSGLASILNATTPIWGVLVAHMLTRDEPLTGRKLSGVILGFAGVAVMIGPAFLHKLDGAGLAMLGCLVATLCYAFAGVWARRFRAMGVTPTQVATGQLTMSAIVMLPVALVVEHPWAAATPSLGAVGAILAIALLSTAIGYILYFRLIDTAGATNALLVTLLVPPMAIVLGAAFLSEVLAPRDFAGMALIALGLAAIDGRLLRLLASRRPRPAA